MLSEELHFKPTENTPEVYLSQTGIVRIRGRAMTLHSPEFTDRIMKWIDEYAADPADKTSVILAFEYLNSSGVAFLMAILRKLARVVTDGKKLDIQWYYEEGDHDIQERGEYMAVALNLSVRFIKTTGHSERR